MQNGKYNAPINVNLTGGGNVGNRVGFNNSLKSFIELPRVCNKTETEILKNRSRAWVQIKQTLLLNVQAGLRGVKEKLLKILIRRSGKERNLLHMPTALQL